MRACPSCVSSALTVTGFVLLLVFLFATLAGCASAGSPAGDSLGSDASPDATGLDAAPPDATGVDADGPDATRPDAASEDGSLDATWFDSLMPDAMTVSDAGADSSTDAMGSPDAPSGDGGNRDGAAGVGSFFCSGASPTLSGAVAPILTNTCAGELCHGGTLAGGFGGAKGAHASLVNVMSTKDKCDAGVLVSPGSLSKSYLMNKLTGIGMCPGSQRMPPGSTPLPASEIQSIADWICTGAPNN